MSALWFVEYQRKKSDTRECLWVSVAEPNSMARADLKAARVNAQRLARARLEHEVGKAVILSCRCIEIVHGYAAASELLSREEPGAGNLHVRVTL